MTVDLMADFPVLRSLSAGEINEAIEAGGLGRALLRARIRKVSTPPKRGRPATSRTIGKVIQRRGRKAARRIHPTSTNIQLAEMAQVWRDTFGFNAREAVRQIFGALRIQADERDVHTVAKLLSDLSGREHDRTVARDVQMPCPDPSLLGQLMRASPRR